MATIWILIVISTGYSNAGTTTVIGTFRERTQCELTLSNMPTGPLKSFCVAAPGYIGR